MKSLAMQTAAVLAVTGAAFAGNAQFVEIGPGVVVDMTPDGQFVLGNDDLGVPFIWSEDGGIVSIAGATAVAFSDDASIVLGEIVNPDTGQLEAALWTKGTGWVSLGGLPGSPGCDAFLSNPYDLSGSGARAVGLGWDVCSGRAFSWTEDTGMVALPQLGPNSARANAVSGNGTTVGGWDEDPTGPRRAAVWTECTEFLPLEGITGNAEGIGEVWGFNSCGTVVVGQAHSDIATGGGFRYMNGNVDIIPPLPGTDPFFNSVAGFAVSEDGEIVVGLNLSGFGPFGTFDATIWTEEAGVQKLEDVLEDGGATIPVNLSLAWAEAISADGTIVAGHARDGFANTAFIAHLPGPSSADLNGDGVVNVVDLLELLAQWGPACN